MRLININKFAPKTAILFGVIPNSTRRNAMAEIAKPFKIMVSTESPNKNNKFHFSWAFLVTAVTEKRIMAITPINNALNINKKLRSL